MWRPNPSKTAFEGLVHAVSRMEADDLTDLSDEECKELDAARDWISRMQAWFNQKEASKKTKNSL